MSTKVSFDYGKAKAANAISSVEYSARNVLKGLSPRDPQHEIELAQEIFSKAMLDGIWGYGPVFPGLFVKKDHVSRHQRFDAMTEDINEIFEAQINDAMLSAVASEGPITMKKFWIKLSETEYKATPTSPPMNLFFTLPDLALANVHQKICMVLSEDIAQYIREGGRTYIISYLESKKLKFARGRKAFAFPKAIYANNFPDTAEARDQLKEDMTAIFAGMANNAKGKGPRPAIKFLGSY